jgi:hypothetical protein
LRRADAGDDTEAWQWLTLLPFLGEDFDAWWTAAWRDRGLRNGDGITASGAVESAGHETLHVNSRDLDRERRADQRRG